MYNYILPIQHVDKSMIATVGGKAANLGELHTIKHINVPAGFCVTTVAFQEVVFENEHVLRLIDQLDGLIISDRSKVADICSQIRWAIENIAIPGHIVAEIKDQLAVDGSQVAYALRSSATAEDLPTASFAGQQDSFLNITGIHSILEHLSKCWASLYTDRAVIYRMQNGWDHKRVQLAVIIQKMVFSEASGILFTADPVTSNRKVVSIDAGFGLGSALVEGRVSADNYKTLNGCIVEKRISFKKMAVSARLEGGTEALSLSIEQQESQVLNDEEILYLADLGRKIEAHFGCPQDIEWCFADHQVFIVQSRPITTLFPIPKADDEKKHVYISVGHQQMMTDAMKPLGISFFLLKVVRPMDTAGGRLFVDISENLSKPESRKALLDLMEQSDPLLKDAIMNILKRGDIINIAPGEHLDKENSSEVETELSSEFKAPFEEQSNIVQELIQESQRTISVLEKEILSKSGAELFDFILDDITMSTKLMLNPQVFQLIMAIMNAANWINCRIERWLGEKNAADILTQSAPNNITSQMGLDLLDVADVIRPYPELVTYLSTVKEDNFLEQMHHIAGGQLAKDAICGFLDKYGMRCTGEIDITRPRWREKPSTLIPLILSNIKSFDTGAAKRKFEQGLRNAKSKEQELLNRIRTLSGGEEMAVATKKAIDFLRNYCGFREYPKYDIICRYFIYKRALLREADVLLRAGIIDEIEDIFYLDFNELKGLVQTRIIDKNLIANRRTVHEQNKRLNPPRVITSDGEIFTGEYKRENLPANAIIGLPVSTGIVEGRARIIFNMEDADIEEGDILITPFTDPSWTPLFVLVKGLITEVGGLMTHGAVIAREYGLPAIVGVENATRLIQDGQIIRLNGTEGFIEII
ncbi:phosphoenolpyruvate synthase [Chitinophaga caeni]|uniref:Prodigiosin synthesizing transferase PigC n=1 Tax=Chitinophaga caeni TaxID=2029983 RepID=A0A291QZF6_9BACT|nr:phosphoenolpyruvate synthase [Chitinophaga caeni]ATL49409.1 phosphoenolpyruvate synthase [Chitinophaga caeni]